MKKRRQTSKKHQRNKKRAAKKKTQVFAGKPPLKESFGEKCFYVCSGEVLKSMLDLADSLETMQTDVFIYHVNEQKNDFANWIKDVLCEPVLAEELYLIKDKDKTQIAVLRFILKNALKKVK